MSRLPAILGGPVVLAQAAALRRRTPLLDPPAEPWHGIAGTGIPARSILVLGDSTAIGTGVADAREALASRIAERLGARDGVAVAWRGLGHNGDTAAEVRRDHLAGALEVAADDVVVLVGWNDAMRLVSPRTFAREFETLINAPRAARAGTRVLAVLPPRFERYAVMPRPLRNALGSSADGIRRSALRVAAARGVPTVPGFDGSTVDPRDRFHPDAGAYDRMAASIARALP